MLPDPLCLAIEETKVVVHNHAKCIDHTLQKAEQLCNYHGTRLTPIRRKVLELICKEPRPVKAYDLLNQVKPNSEAKPTTVYRALDFLLEQGLIHKVESLNAYVSCNVPEQQHHEPLFLICEYCGEIEERPAQKLMESIAWQKNTVGFQTRKQIFELHGVCARCTSNATI